MQKISEFTQLYKLISLVGRSDFSKDKNAKVQSIFAEAPTQVVISTERKPRSSSGGKSTGIKANTQKNNSIMILKSYFSLKTESFMPLFTL